MQSIFKPRSYMILKGNSDPSYLIAELRKKLKDLEQVLGDIEDEFKRKGELREYTDAKVYKRKSGLFFNHIEYGEKMNLLVRRNALEVTASRQEDNKKHLNDVKDNISKINDVLVSHEKSISDSHVYAEAISHLALFKTKFKVSKIF